MKFKFCWHKGFPLKWRTDVSTYFCPHCDIVCPAPCWTCRCKQAAAAWMNTSADRLNIQQDILLFMTLYRLIILVTTSLTSCRSYVLCRTVDCIFSHVHVLVAECWRHIWAFYCCTSCCRNMFMTKRRNTSENNTAVWEKDGIFQENIKQLEQ